MGTRSLRKTSEATKKQVAASQRWTCAHCSELLSSSFEVDHTIPLWRNGADAVENLRALCSNCHSQKSQKESQERAAEKRSQMEEARSRYERGVEREEETKRVTEEHSSGTVRCMECSRRYYPVFRHNCIKVAERVHARLNRTPGPKPRQQTVNTGVPVPLFGEYYFTARVADVASHSRNT